VANVPQGGTFMVSWCCPDTCLGNPNNKVNMKIVFPATSNPSPFASLPDLPMADGSTSGASYAAAVIQCFFFFSFCLYFKKKKPIDANYFFYCLF